MSYREYVIAAYLVFAIAMLWDWLLPKLQIARALRAARQQARRRAAQARQGNHPHEPHP
ncbi:heme exporter protein CcmD [Lysobacteraceae bacterium NML71-0210]|nr:heme exporter protein CcmD [Xanthomonadaceae bacterium NML71-0210]